MGEELFSKLREKGFRITEPRKKIISLLRGKHLTFKEIRDDMHELGFKNVATLYNNIDFLLENKIITEIFINNIKYYDLTIENFAHSHDNYIHVVSKATNQIEDIMDDSIFDLIKQHPKMANYDIDSIHIAIKKNN